MWTLKFGLKFGWVIFGFASLPSALWGDHLSRKKIQEITHCVNPEVLRKTEAPEKNKHHVTELFHISYERNNVVLSSSY